MSEQSEEKALRQGHECAMSALAAERERIACLNPADRLHWWLGFVAAAMGAALSSVGEPAFRKYTRLAAPGRGQGTDGKLGTQADVQTQALTRPRRLGSAPPGPICRKWV
jgi:hypothetical protein